MNWMLAKTLWQQGALRLGWIAVLGLRGLAQAWQGLWPGGVSRGGQKQEHPQPSRPSSWQWHALSLHVVMELGLLGGQHEALGLRAAAAGVRVRSQAQDGGQRARGRREESWHLDPILGIQGIFEQGWGAALGLLGDPFSAQLWQKGSGPCRITKEGSSSYEAFSTTAPKRITADRKMQRPRGSWTH